MSFTLLLADSPGGGEEFILEYVGAHMSFTLLSTNSPGGGELIQIMWGPHLSIYIGAECRRKRTKFSENTTRNTQYRASRKEKIS